MLGLLHEYLRRSDELSEPLSLLDVGCGTGYAREALVKADLGHLLYTPSDFVERDLEGFVELDVTDPLSFASPGHYDIAYIGGVLEYVSEPLGALNGLRMIADRIILGYTADRRPKAGSGTYKSWLTTDELADYFAGSGGSRRIGDLWVGDGKEPLTVHYAEWL